MTEKSQGGMAKALEPFVCGGAAATFASVFIHPIDLAKVGNAMSVTYLIPPSHRRFLTELLFFNRFGCSCMVS